MRYELRRCTDEDHDWAYALKSEAYRDVVTRQFGPWDEDFQRRLFAQRWNPTASSVILVSGVPAGLVAVKKRSDGWWLDEIQLLAAWRNRGLGTQIVGDLLQRGPVSLQVLKQNVRALELYRRLGFQFQAETATHWVMRHSGLSAKEELKRSAAPTPPAGPASA